MLYPTALAKLGYGGNASTSHYINTHKNPCQSVVHPDQYLSLKVELWDCVWKVTIALQNTGPKRLE